MRIEGKLARWEDDRGFGFIAPCDGGAEIFVHIKAFEGAGRRPELNERLTFAIQLASDGRKRAVNVRRRAAARIGRGVRAPEAAQWGGFSLLAIVALILLFAAMAFFWRLSGKVAGFYLFASLICYMAYAADKRAAGRGARRTPENTLHILALIGGWPGALLAQQLLRHKSVKAEFRSAFWATVLFNVAGLVWLASPFGRAFLSRLAGA